MKHRRKDLKTEVNLANKDTEGCFGQECLHFLAGSLPLVSAILTYFQMSSFLCALGWLAGRCLWEKGIKRTVEMWMWGKWRTSQRKDGKPNCHEVLMQRHCQRLPDVVVECCIVDQHPMTRLKENLEARQTPAEERRPEQENNLLAFAMCLMLSQCG